MVEFIAPEPGIKVFGPHQYCHNIVNNVMYMYLVLKYSSL